jgi:molecular chaperone DnaK
MNQSDTVLLERLAVGIDLGTTYSAIAYVDQHGRQALIPNSENERLTPSVILFDGQHAVVGSVARQNAVAEPEKIVDFVKREMGKSKAQFHREFEGRKYSAEELSALILRKLRNDAEKFLGRAITDAVITVPAYFNDAERTATVQAGKLAGLNVIGIINEPTAAALAYGFRQLEGKKKVLVFDLGGGTLDVTIMDIAENQIRMLASNGDHRLGGKDWDDLICSWAAEAFELEHGDNPMLDLDSYQDLYGRSVVAKSQLSSRESVIFNYSYNGHGMRLELTRTEFEERSRYLVEQCKMICEIGLAEAHLESSQIDGILLVGGMTRMPSVRAMLANFAPGVPLIDFVNPDEVVALGAAIQANLQLLQEEDEAGKRTIPEAVRGQFSGRDGELIKVSNITTHSLGVVIWDHALQEETVHAMIKRSTEVPASVTKSFGLSKDNLTSMRISVVEGESSVPSECYPLGICEIELPPGLSRGTPISLTYSYTEDQVLEVLVEADGKQSAATLTRSTGVSEEDVVAAAAEMLRIEVV